VISLASFVLAQQPSSQPTQPATPPGWSPSKDIGVFVFGRNGQSRDQQLKDESECYGAAKQATGIDRKAHAPAGKTAEQKAAIGAIAEGAGTGAGAGAVAYTMRGGMTQRQANAAAKEQAAAQVAAKQQKEQEQARLAHAEGLDTFQRTLGRAWMLAAIQ